MSKELKITSTPVLHPSKMWCIGYEVGLTNYDWLFKNH